MFSSKVKLLYMSSLLHQRKEQLNHHKACICYLYLQSSDTHDKCHALWVTRWNYSQRLHVLHIYISAFSKSLCVDLACVRPVRAAEMIREQAGEHNTN